MEDNRPATSRPMTSGQDSDSSGSTFAPTMTSARPASRRKFSNDTMTARTRPESRISSITSGMESARPFTKASRLQSAVRPMSSFRQGSALRTATARPPSGITAGSLPLHASVNIMDRPVTQQGVSGLRSARTGYGNRRQIHDKTYFVGILHTKMAEINAEIQKLNTAAEALAKEQSTYIAYETRVKEKIAELQEMNGDLSDYNILSDMIASDKDKLYLEEELKTLRRENANDSQRNEIIYNRRREAEGRVLELEKLIDEERHKANHLIESLNPALRNKYEQLVHISQEMQGQMEHLQMQLDDLNSRKSELYDRVSRSELKKKAAQLEEDLLESEEKRDALWRDAESQETPEEESERLLHQVKTDNSEISTLERQLAELNEQIRKAQEELRSMDQEIEESDSDRQQKYRELKKREIEMDEFMRAYEDNKAKEMEQLSRLEAEVMTRMDKISRTVHLASTLPETGMGFSELREDLEFKEEEFDKARYTNEMIEYRNDALKKQLDNFNDMEDKLKEEKIQLEDRMTQMQLDLKKFQNTETLKSDAAEKNIRLQQEAVWLEQRIKKLSELLRNSHGEYDKLKNELDNHEVRRQLSTLEKKWSMLEETNFKSSSALQAKRSETDYEGVKKQALDCLTDLNKTLQNTKLNAN